MEKTLANEGDKPMGADRRFPLSLRGTLRVLVVDDQRTMRQVIV
jgi:hypothetical protein